MPPSTARPTRTSWRSWWSTACFTSLAWTTRPTLRRSGWSASSASSWPATTIRTPGRPAGDRATGPRGDRHRRLPGGRLAADCRDRRPAGNLGVPGPLRDQPGPHLPGQGPGPARRTPARGSPARSAGRTPRAVLEPGPAAGADLPAGLGHPGRGAGLGLARGPRGARGHRLRGGRHLRPLRGGPKNWAVHNPERAALIAAPIVYAVVRFPLVRGISWVLIGLANLLIGRGDGENVARSNVTESELLAMADVAHADDVIETTERAFIHSIIDFGDAVVREVKIGRPDMVALEADATVSAGLEEALEAGYSRLPVHDHNVDDIVGIAYVKDLVKVEHEGRGGDPVRNHVRPAHFVPESKRLTSLLAEMQDRKYHLSIVVDEYGGTAGLVTLEDLIEELIGEIVDEYDVEEPMVERQADGSVVVTARMGIDDADELLDAELPTGAWDTVGGLLLDLAGRVPREGESFAVDGFRLIAQRVQGRRIGRVRIERTGPPPGAPEQGG